jgi:hypothetical protein
MDSEDWPEGVPYPVTNPLDHALRSPDRYIQFIKRPTFFFDQSTSDSSPPWAQLMAKTAAMASVPLHIIKTQFTDDEDIAVLIAQKITADTEPTCQIQIAGAEITQVQKTLATGRPTLRSLLEAWNGVDDLDLYLEAVQGPPGGEPNAAKTLQDVSAMAQAIDKAAAIRPVPNCEAMLILANEWRQYVGDDASRKPIDAAFERKVIVPARAHLCSLLERKDLSAQQQEAALRCLLRTNRTDHGDELWMLMQKAMASETGPECHVWKDIFGVLMQGPHWADFVKLCLEKEGRNPFVRHAIAAMTEDPENVPTESPLGNTAGAQEWMRQAFSATEPSKPNGRA